MACHRTAVATTDELWARTEAVWLGLTETGNRNLFLSLPRRVTAVLTVHSRATHRLDSSIRQRASSATSGERSDQWEWDLWTASIDAPMLTRNMSADMATLRTLTEGLSCQVSASENSLREDVKSEINNISYLVDTKITH
ncbi:hypothetical protein PR048_011970 [Dryococelus australis]|uniref:Uncharacterized protein n=1 Tax=Dryococelus australis TaxID=614101 RepID=A0ABQ9HNB9_9NEOP|nr:hypothetical protein PR048_011970 [Dryococelus australis]